MGRRLVLKVCPEPRGRVPRKAPLGQELPGFPALELAKGWGPRVQVQPWSLRRVGPVKRLAHSSGVDPAGLYLVSLDRCGSLPRDTQSVAVASWNLGVRSAAGGSSPAWQPSRASHRTR